LERKGDSGRPKVIIRDALDEDDDAARNQLPWNGGRKLISYWDMKRFFAGHFAEIMRELASWIGLCLLEDKETSKETAVIMFKHLEVARDHCKRINNQIGLAKLDSIIRNKERALGDAEWLGDQVHELTEMIVDDMKKDVFLQIPRNEASLYDKGAAHLFGDEVYANFRSAIQDIEEAAKCLALDRATACIFHLMRVMEVGLKTLATTLGLPYFPGWESYLKKIDDELRKKYGDKSPDWLAIEPFYRDAAAHLSTVKFAWRNPTMHIEKSYKQEEAVEIYGAVRSFMRHLATNLKE
jgi:hypothetical protein